MKKQDQHVNHNKIGGDSQSSRKHHTSGYRKPRSVEIGNATVLVRNNSPGGARDWAGAWYTYRGS